ncbi:unnamed protein product [Polarella glacialis]|nr:unnamed protein product [Polarella glacialis]CAE8636003.1 unnamed protein product [Polarella glacialis]
MLRRARHPHIIELVAAFEDVDANAFYLQFPFYEHGSIDQWCLAEKPSEMDRRRMIYEALQALAHLHSLGITHADVKPANILIGGDGHARLADFDVSIDGTARTCRERLRRTATHIDFTLAFVAPELFKEGASPATDMFAFGTTVATIIKPDGGSQADFVNMLQQPKPSDRLTASLAMKHAFFQPLFEWQQEEVHFCCIMSSEMCQYGTKDVNLDSGLLCGGSAAHFACNECMDKHVAAAAIDEMRRKREREGRVYCPNYPRECNCAPYPDSCLARAITAKVFDEYTRACIALLEEQKVQELEIEMRARLDAEIWRLTELDEEQRAVLTACRHIREEILTLRCPRCAQAFLDFEGCFALKCSRCECVFCGWCLTDCGPDSHEHVRTCNLKPNGADLYFGTFEDFEDAMRRRQRQLLAQYLSKLDETTKKAVKSELHAELKGLLP